MNKKETQPISRERQLILDDFEKNYWRSMGKRVLKDWRLYLMLLPLLLLFLFWRYFPMYELTAAFRDYDEALKGHLDKMDFVGLYWFKQLLFGTSGEQFWPAFRNTFLLSFYGLLFGFPTPILLALFFSEIKSNIVRSVFQIATYLPKFVSLVVITSLIQLLLRFGSINPTTGVTTLQPGVLSQLMLTLGMIPESAAYTGLVDVPRYFRSIYQISGIWAEAGYGSIVYFAAIIGISPTSYEAARIDGATKMGQVKYVVIPGILSTIVIMLIMRLGHLMTIGYEKIILLRSTSNKETAEVISTYVFDLGGLGGTTGLQTNKSLGSAADMLNAIISMLLVTGANMISKRASNTSLF